jgi:hypothetical protein
MAETTSGNYLNTYVAPQLLQEFKNYKDDFVGAIPGVPQQALSADGVRFNKLINNVGFYVDNASDFTAKKMTGSKTFVPWEKYDTDPTEADDAEVRNLAYDKRAEIRLQHALAMKLGLRNHIMWKLAPSEEGVSGMPTLRTTGAAINGRKRLTFADLVLFLEMAKALSLPMEDQLSMILCPEHSTDLILDRDSAAYFADKSIFIDYATGKVKSVMGFKFYENGFCPSFTADGDKKPVGATLGAGDRNASTFFYPPNSIKHLEQVKILYKPETIDTKSADPKSEFRLQCYGLIDKVVDYGFGALISANV